jgi:peptidoglycan/LPS O-acetylase OafA/YrhL
MMAQSNRAERRLLSARADLSQQHGGLTRAWTLTIEAAFYAFLPPYAWAQRRIPGRSRSAALRSEVIGLVVFLVISEAWKGILLAHGNPYPVVIIPRSTCCPPTSINLRWG